MADVVRMTGMAMFFCMLICVCKVVYHMAKIIQNIRADRYRAANFFGPLTLLAPNILNKVGEAHRKNVFIYLALSGATFFAMILLGGIYKTM